MRVTLRHFKLINFYHGQHARASGISLAKSLPTTISSKERSRTQTRSIHSSTYSPTSITAALAAPSSLSTNQHVLIGSATYRLDEKDNLYRCPEPWDPLLVLHALEALPGIKSISVDLDHMMFHSATCDESAGYRDDEAPEDILKALGLECRCTAL